MAIRKLDRRETTRLNPTRRLRHLEDDDLMPLAGKLSTVRMADVSAVFLLGVLDEWKVSGHPDKLAVVDYVRRNKDMLEDEAAEENVVDYGDIPF